MLPLQGTIAYPLPLVDDFPNFPALVGYVSSKNSLEGTVPLDVSRRDFTWKVIIFTGEPSVPTFRAGRPKPTHGE